MCGSRVGFSCRLGVRIAQNLADLHGDTLELARQGALAPGALPAIALVIAGSIVLVVLVERARRRLPVEFAERGGMHRQTADIALKLNPAGLMPVFIMGVLFSIIVLVLSFAALLANLSGWTIPLNFAIGEPVRLVGTAVLIVLLTFVYTAFVCDPEQMAARLAACGGALPGIAPGEPTAAYLDRAISRSAALGAVYLVVVIVVPELVMLYFGLPMIPGGPPILVLVCVVLDLIAEIRAHRAQDR